MKNTLKTAARRGRSCPLSYTQAVEAYFLEHRGKLIDLAAFLDRLDRAGSPSKRDYRVAAMLRALKVLSDGQPDRARRVLELLSDPTASPTTAAGPPAAGAPCANTPNKPRRTRNKKAAKRR